MMISDLFLVSVLLLLLLLLPLPLLLPLIAEGDVEDISRVAAVLTLLLLVMMLCVGLFPLSLTLICWFKVCWLRTIFDDDDDTSDEEEDDDAFAEMVMLCIILSTTLESTSSSPPDIDSDSLELCTISPPPPTLTTPSLVAVVDELVGIVMLVDDARVPSIMRVCIVVSPSWFLLASLASASFKAMASRLMAFFSYRRQVTSSLLLTS